MFPNANTVKKKVEENFRTHLEICVYIEYTALATDVTDAKWSCYRNTKLGRVTEMSLLMKKCSHEIQTDNWNASGVATKTGGRKRGGGSSTNISFFVLCKLHYWATVRYLWKKSNCSRRCTARFLLVDATRPLNIHILAGVNFKILSWMSNFSFIASRAKFLSRLKGREMPPRKET